MSTIQTEAIVLRRTNYGEADRILQILTPAHGKLSVMARGVRKERSKLAGGVELFAVSDVVIRQGRGDIGTLTGARLHTFFAHILDNYEKMQFGYEVIKRVGAAAEMVPEPEWYDLAKEAFGALNQPAVSSDVTELWFWLRHAALLGQGLNVLTDTKGQKLSGEARYAYDVAEMGFREYERGDITADHIKLLRIASVKPPEVLHRIGGLDDVLPVCLWVVRQHAK